MRVCSVYNRNDADTNQHWRMFLWVLTQVLAGTDLSESTVTALASSDWQMSLTSRPDSRWRVIWIEPSISQPAVPAAQRSGAHRYTPVVLIIVCSHNSFKETRLVFLLCYNTLFLGSYNSRIDTQWKRITLNLQSFTSISHQRFDTVFCCVRYFSRPLH